MTAPRVLGLDLSLRSTGIAGSGWTERIKPPGRGHQRLSYILGNLSEYLTPTPPTLVVIEGPAYSRALQQGHHELAGLWWMVTHKLWRSDVPYAVAPPQELKRYALGKAGGPDTDKYAVYAAVIRRYPDVDINSHDEADAYVLAAMGLDRLGHPPVTVPKNHRAALQKVDWPDQLNLLEEVSAP